MSQLKKGECNASTHRFFLIFCDAILDFASILKHTIFCKTAWGLKEHFEAPSGKYKQNFNDILTVLDRDLSKLVRTALWPKI